MSKDLSWKFWHIFLPVLLLMLVAPPVYAAAIWLLGKCGLEIDREMVTFWLPAILGFGLVAFFVQPNVDMLRFSKKNNLSSLYFLVAGFALAVPIGIAQWGVQAASAKVANVPNAAAIAANDGVTYYIPRSVCMDRTDARVYRTVRRNVKSGVPEDFEMFVAVPVCGQSGAPAVWIGLEYTGAIADHSSDTIMDSEYNAFTEETARKFEGEDTSTFRHLEKLGPSTERRNFMRAVQSSGTAAASPIVLAPHKEPFARQTGSAINFLLWSFAVGLPLWLVMALTRQLDHDKLAARDGPEAKAERFLISMFYRPRRDIYGAAVLIDLNLLVFAAMAFSGLGFISFEVPDLVAWGANYGPLDHGWGLLRLVSSQFVHGGLSHLLGNMYGLVFACFFLMPIAKNARLILSYVVCGIAGSLASVFVHPTIVSVGASGAIMGLWGMLLALALLHDERIAGNEKGIFINVGVFAGFTLLIGSFASNVDNWAHVGGFVAGLLVGSLCWLVDRRDGVRIAQKI